VKNNTKVESGKSLEARVKKTQQNSYKPSSSPGWNLAQIH